MKPDSDQARTWDEVLAPRLLAIRSWLSTVLAPHGLAALDWSSPRPGARALDVGCGVGDTAIELARRVRSEGSVLGVDLCEAFLSVARDEAHRAGVPNVAFLHADAQVHSFARDFDYCFSRFGVQFFADPLLAFTNLRRALVPGGQFCAVVWDALDRNPWLHLPYEVALRHIPGVSAHLAGSPGPFSLSDPNWFAELLVSAGFVEVEVRVQELVLHVGRSPRQVAPLLLRFGPAAEALRHAGAEGDRARPRIEAELAESLASSYAQKGVALPSRAWRATAVER